jgi:transposase
MPRTGKTHPPSRKAKVAVLPIRGIRTTAEIDKVFDVHHNLVADWKRQALEQLPALFAGTQATRHCSDAEA